jgi:hypothetical protein
MIPKIGPNVYILGFWCIAVLISYPITSRSLSPSSAELLANVSAKLVKESAHTSVGSHQSSAFCCFDLRV